MNGCILVIISLVELLLALTENGEYTLVATDANDCQGRRLNLYSNTVDVSEFEDLDFLVYPNPVIDYLYIELQNSQI